jgi:hypothetical protein
MSNEFETFRPLAIRLDRLMSMDIACRGVIDVLYSAAAKLQDNPLVLVAAKSLMQRIHPGDAVFIATGWMDQPLVDPDHGETDGPPGAIALARALRITCKARPIILTDASLVDGMVELARAAGCQCVPPENLHYSISMNKLLTLSILPFPEDWSSAEKEAARLFTEFSPAACIGLERGGMNEHGVIHNMGGMNTNASQAKLDAVFVHAAKTKTLTLGIGDGGNEIGMANIADCIRESIPFGRECQCGCGGGLAPSNRVDVLMAAAVSNWGAYALAAMLAALTGLYNALPDPIRERRVLEATIGAGFHDAIYGEVCGSVDGAHMETQLAIVELMREAVLQFAKQKK